MRIRTLLAIVATAVGLGFAAPQPASAFDFDRPDQPAGYGWQRTVRHWVYYPRYRHVYLTHPATDPYHYRWEPRGYYPYYNSGYWGPARAKRFHGKLPKYYASWGAVRPGYRHVEWHRRHYGGHRRGAW